ncbi:LytR/AlgR family response regulator transcription factor [Lewinella cohaerens]|uniref:LytR/AlgR family response regulator transcription factor n=1 Tax=Lewinella cohaerens TaxID=70995 RepID=UPI0003622A05|nr:LytTR family DNA-binding domain-containing protein [Lewinella cohaerens]
MPTTKEIFIGITKVLNQLSPQTLRIHRLVWFTGLIIINLPALKLTFGNFHSDDYSLLIPSFYGVLLNAFLFYGTVHFVTSQSKPDFHQFFRNSMPLLVLICFIESQIDAGFFLFFYGELNIPIYLDILLGAVIMNTIFFYLPALVLGVILRWKSTPAFSIPRIEIKDGQQKIFLAPEEVFFVESDSNYAIFHTARGRLLQRTSLTRLEEELPNQFTRCHRSFIVNQQHIQKRSAQEIEVAGNVVPIGRKYKNDI